MATAHGGEILTPPPTVLTLETVLFCATQGGCTKTWERTDPPPTGFSCAC